MYEVVSQKSLNTNDTEIMDNTKSFNVPESNAR